MPYIGKKPADIIATAVDTTTGTFSGAVSASSVDADGGVTVDNITIDGTEIDLSSGDLTIDVAGDIILDAGGGDVNFQDDGTLYGFMAKSSDNLLVGNAISDGDVLIRGNDGGSNITALSFDMSDGGAATFAKGITLTNGNIAVANGNGIDFSSASGSASGSASALLDDYEEGTWTPSYAGAGSAPTIGYGIQAGSYVKVGNLVHVQGRVRTDSTSGGSGNLLLGGLPFTSLSTSEHFSTLHVGYSQNWSADNFAMSLYTNNGSTTCFINHFRADDPRDGIGILITTSDLTNASSSNDMIFSGTYIAE